LHLDVDTSPKTPEIDNADEEIKRIVARMLKSTGLDKIDKKFMIDGREVTYVDQAKIELNRFIDKGFSSYFLITRDLVSYGRKRGWPFSPRGSAGGSLVCYLMGIHTLDPMKWGLSFDRFLSPSRGGYMLNLSMPDPIN
jgi:DNA polymerase III alpha subunit